MEAAGCRACSPAYEANQRMLTHAKEHGRVFEVQGVLDDWMHILRPRRRMQELVQKLKSPRLLRLLPEQHPGGCAGPADGAGLSRACLTVVSPPVKSTSTSRTPAFIRRCWTNTSLKARESVFIDDRLENVQAAFRAGLCRHPDEGQRRHTGAQPCYLQRRGANLTATASAKTPRSCPV